MANLLFEDKEFISEQYLLPKQFIGKTVKNGGLTKFNPRKWTKEEIDWVLMLLEKGLSVKQISECIYRDITQTSIKIKRIGKKEKTYNKAHVDDKYRYNDMFLKEINPASVLDLFSGQPSFYLNKGIAKLVTNDVNKSFGADYCERAEKLVAKLWYDGYSFDVIDIDPFGSAYDCFDLSIKMAKKGIVITFGELGHKRFKRLDYVKRYYNIDSIEDFNVQSLINHVIIIGERNKKNLIPIYIREWKGISRVYFKIEKTKIWHKTNLTTPIQNMGEKN